MVRHIWYSHHVMITTERCNMASIGWLFFMLVTKDWKKHQHWPTLHLCSIVKHHSKHNPLFHKHFHISWIYHRKHLMFYVVLDCQPVTINGHLLRHRNYIYSPVPLVYLTSLNLYTGIKFSSIPAIV